MARTEKVLYAGRFGARYGRRIRQRVVEVEKEQRARHTCPKCGFKRVKRISTGIFFCSKCKETFAGGAFVPETMSGKIVRKMVAQRTFVPFMKEIIESREKKPAEMDKEAEEALELEEKETGKKEVKERESAEGKESGKKEKKEKGRGKKKKKKGG